VLGLLGENGAGKSTLIKILAGAYAMDGGTVVLEGQKVDITDPSLGKRLGIRVIYQELNTLDHLSVAENIFLGEPRKGRLGRVDWKAMHEETAQLLRTLDVDLDPRSIMERLTTSQKQIIEIARAISKQARIIVMDEPTAALGEKEEEVLFRVIENLKQKGIGVIYISHKLSEIFRITDRVMVLRDGRLIGSVATSDTNRDELVRMMVGRELTDMYPKVEIPVGEVILEVRGLSCASDFQDISFELRRGEILGLFGLEGSGRTALMNTIFGAHPKERASLRVGGRHVRMDSPTAAKKAGLGLIPISRKEEGVTLTMSVADNIVMTTISELGRGPLLDRREQRKRASHWIGALNIRTPSVDTEVDSLSGGNQQKVAISKWLESRAKVFLMNEPTRGIDVGAKVEIYKLMETLCKEGHAVIMSSSELPEILSIPDRVLVMARGRLTAEFRRDEADKEKLVHAASL
jgi:ribose transport system ATP-binding protein